MPRPVLLSRPQAQMTATANLLREHDYQVLELPLTGIAPAAKKPSQTQLQQTRTAQWLIFTSRNAVRAAAALLQYRAGQHVMAIGGATALALRHAGWPVHWVPPQSDTASVFDAPDRPNIQGPVVIIGGSGGRRSLKAGFLKRGVPVSKLIVYRRIALRPERDVFLAALAAQPLLVFSSGHALRQWQASAEYYQRDDAFDLPLLVASPRLCKLAKQLGYRRRAHALERMSDIALLAALREHNS